MNEEVKYSTSNADATVEAKGGVELKRFTRSPRLAEMKVAYRSRTKVLERQTIRIPQDAERYLRLIWNKATLELVEEFVVVCLNGSHQATGWVKVSSGGFNAASIDLRVVFAIALQTASTAIVVAHNHPSGSPEPSGVDIQLTRRLKEAGKLLTVDVLDHIILTKEASFSFSEHGLM